MDTGEIIPGLPDDLGLRCLARVSHGLHGVLETVCKRWRDVIRSPEYAALKSLLGWSGDWIFVLTGSSSNRQNPPNWIAYDPLHDAWHALPPIPALDYSHLHHRGFSSLSVAGRFLVIGGSFSALDSPLASPGSTTNLVFWFDPFHRRWKTLASMHTARSHFACSVISGKVFVAGGRNPSFPRGMPLAEVYDPLTNRWDELPAMPESQSDCVGLSYKGRFYVLSDQVGLSETNISQVFNPCSNSWCTHNQAWPFSRAMQFGIQVTEDDKVYAIADSGTSVIKTWMDDHDEWRSVSVIPPVVIPGHARPLETFSYGFTALRGKLYVLGGNVLRWQEFGLGSYSIVKLNVVRVCDPKAQPPQWKEVSPMCTGAAGSIIGCASLEVSFMGCGVHLAQS